MWEEAKICFITGVATAGVCVSTFLVAQEQKESVWSAQGNLIGMTFQSGITTKAVNIVEGFYFKLTKSAWHRATWLRFRLWAPFFSAKRRQTSRSINHFDPVYRPLLKSTGPRERIYWFKFFEVVVVVHGLKWWNEHMKEVYTSMHRTGLQRGEVIGVTANYLNAHQMHP